MSRGKIFAVRVSSGSYDDYSNHIEFVSGNKQYVDNWVKKYNALLIKMKDFYESKWNTNSWENQGDIRFSKKSWKYDEAHEADIIEIEIR